MKNKEEIERGSEVLIDGIVWAIVEEHDPDTGYYFCIDRIGGEHDVTAERLDFIQWIFRFTIRQKYCIIAPCKQ